MKNKALTVMIACLCLSILGFDISAFAEDIKSRMKNRLPVIKALKDKGLVGEDSQGLLQFVGSKKEKAEVVAAENRDRMTIYAAIAKRQGATPELVGQRRAIQIGQRARAGEWLQDAGGKWYQKK
ncbi:MAG: YdbL family protein [Deltaproteobacteria bacterium]|nr:YdbL family protein [Deltaproteobacteria bacterium]